MIRIVRSLAAATLMLAIVFGTRMAFAQTTPARTCSGDPRVSVGGVAGFAALADPAATAGLRRACVGLYIHAEGWKPLDPATQQQILANFKGTGPPVVEIGFSGSNPQWYIGTYYKTKFIDRGVNADVALIVGACGHRGDDPSMSANAVKFIDVAKQYGLNKVGEIMSPNYRQYKDAPFADPRFECIRAAAREGGALAIDTPPHVFLGTKYGYQEWVEDEIRWANSNGISTYFIVSPGSSMDQLGRETSEMIDILAARQALPTNWVFEAYCKLCTDEYHQVGTENDPTTPVGVAKMLLPKIAQ